MASKTRLKKDIHPGEGNHPEKYKYRITKSIEIRKPVEDVYGFWRNLSNLPLFMSHLKSVTVLDNRRSRWETTGPAGSTLSWEAEITADRNNEFISWHSVADSEVDNAGSVSFERLPIEDGTRITVTLAYNPPAGALGESVARLFREDASRQVEDALRRFSDVMENRTKAA